MSGSRRATAASTAEFEPTVGAGRGDGLRAAVVGAGAVGVTAAHDLAVAGADVTMYERGPTVASGSSGRAAGVVHDAFAEDVDVRLADRAVERFRALSGEGAFAFRDCPYVMLAREGDERRARAVEESVERMRVHGRDVALVDSLTLGERFPLAVDDAGVAAVAENGGWTEPESYVRTVAERARAAGAAIRTNAPARLDFGGDEPGVIIDGESDGDGDGDAENFDAVVVAAGAHTKQVLADAGVPVPLKAYRVQALVSRGSYEGPMCYDATAGAYLRPHAAGLLAGDGTEAVAIDPDDYRRGGDDWFVDEVSEWLRARAAHEVDVERAWAGLCVATPDRDPLLGELRPGLFVAAGWQGHGFMRAPATGEAVAKLALGADAGVAPFDPTRFDGEEEFEIVEGMTVE